MIRLLSNEDESLVMDYIAEYEIETTFFHANISDLGIDNKKDIGRCADYYGFFENGALKGILAFYNLGSCIPHYVSNAAVDSFVELMKDRSFGALLGMKRLIKPLFDGLSAYKGPKEYNESLYMVNRNPRRFIADGLELVDADSADDDEVQFIVDSFSKWLENPPRTVEKQRESLQSRSAEEDFVLARMQGKYVSQACIQTYTPTINQVGGVATVPEARGKGYCKAVVSELCDRIVKRGKIPALFVKKNNTPAVKAYTALGFEPYDDYLFIRY